MTSSKKRGTRFEYRVAYAFEEFGYSWDRSGSSLGVDLKILEDGKLRFLVSCKKTSAEDAIYVPKLEVESLSDEAKRREAQGLICYGFYRTPVFVVPLRNITGLEETEKSYKLTEDGGTALETFLDRGRNYRGFRDARKVKRMERAASSSEWSKEKVIGELKRKKEKLGKSPSKREVDGSLSDAATRLFGSWNEAKRAAGLKIFRYRNKWSKEEVVNELRKLADELGRSPISNDNLCLANAARKHFGSWNRAKKAAGLKVFRGDLKERTDWSEERVIQELRDLSEEVGRTPKTADNQSLEYATRRCFGSWNRALKAAGVDSLEPREDAVLVSLRRLEDRKETFREVLEQMESVLPSDSVGSIREDAADILCSIGPFGGHSIRELILGCVYLSCRSNSAVVFPEELAEEVSSGKIEGGKAVRESAKVIRQKMEMSSPPPFGVQEITEKFARTAGFGETALEDAAELGKKATGKLNLSGRPRRSLAAAILYIVGCLHPDCDKLTQAEVEDACDVTGASIRNNLGFLCEGLKRDDLPFTPRPSTACSGVVLEAFVEVEEVKENILREIRELTNQIGRSPKMGDDRALSAAAHHYFGTWNDAKRMAGLKVFKPGKERSSPPETERVDEHPEIDEGRPEGLLTSVKEDADVYSHDLPGEKVKRVLGDVAEALLVSWAKYHKSEVVGDFIQDEDRCRVSYGVPDEHDRCEPRYRITLEGIRCDLLFLIDQPSVGRSFVMFEAKYGQWGISHGQAQYFRKAHHRPGEIVEDAEEGHVVLAKCFNLDIRSESPRMKFYMGELVVPDEDPLEEE